MKQPPKLVEMDTLLDTLESDYPDIEWAVERAWVWLLSDLAPLHKGCECEECTKRATTRKAIGREGLGFLFAKHGHTLPDGQVSHWGHHCDHPVPFRRRKGKQSPKQQQQQQPAEADIISDSELMELVGA